MSVPLRWEEIAPQEPQTVAPPPRRHKTKPRRSVARVAARLFCFAVIGSLSCIGAATVVKGLTPETTLRREMPASSGSEVTLGSATVERRLGYVTVTGEVANQTKASLSKVEAVVELMDARNQTVRMESALISFNPLPAGRVSPFQVQVPDDSRAVAYRVRFKELLGAPLN